MDVSKILSELQTYGRSKDTHRNNLLKDLMVNARVLQHDMNRDVEDRLGALLFIVWQLYSSYGLTEDPGSLAERYAREELTSYVNTAEEVDKLKAWAENNGLALQFLAVNCSDGQCRWIIVSARSQTAPDGKYWEAGEVIPNPLRLTPTALDCLEKLGGF